MTDVHVAQEATTTPHQPWGNEPDTLPARRHDDEPTAPRGAGRLYMTSELRAATGLARTHLDFYLREGIVQATARTESGYLLFDEAELETLREVLRWRQSGLGIKEIRARLGR